MSAKKFSHIFNRVATHGATAFMALALSIGGGVYSYSVADSQHEKLAPVIDVQQSSTAEQALRAQGDALMREQERLNFTAQSLAKMQDNLGTNGSSVKSQLQDLADARAQYDRDNDAQTKRLADYRRTLWLSPALSEQQANKIYTDLFYAAQDKGLNSINNFLAPMTDALTLRSETMQQLNMRYDETAYSHADVQKLVEAARAADAAHDKDEILTGLGFGLLDAALLFSWVGIGFAGRRKEERDAAQEEAEKLARKRANDDFETAQRAAAATAQHQETPVPAKKPAAGGKLNV